MFCTWRFPKESFPTIGHHDDKLRILNHQVVEVKPHWRQTIHCLTDACKYPWTCTCVLHTLDDTMMW
jgi:hypothetical protein